MGGFTGDE
jgi:DNA-binding protein H-NS